MKEGTRFEVCGAVAEKPVAMVNLDGSLAGVDVRLKVAGRQRVHDFCVRVVDKGKAGALEGLAVGTRLMARGRMSGELYKGFHNVYLYADEVMEEVGAADAANVRCTMYDGRCESKAAEPQGKGGER